MKENFLKIIRVLLISIILTLLISSFTTKITQQSKKQNNSDDKELLPDWFLNPPVSIDNSCAYSIGISDPGLNNADAVEQAVMRAKVMMPLLYENDDKEKEKFISSVAECSTKGGAFDKNKLESHYEMIARFVRREKYLSLNFKTVHTAFSKFNEAIVLLKYSFTPHPDFMPLDSIIVKSVYNVFVKDDSKTLSQKYEGFASISDNARIMKDYYLIKKINNKDSVPLFSVLSAFGNHVLCETKAVDLKYKNQSSSLSDSVIVRKYPEKFNALTGLEKGLWSAYIQNYFFGIDCFLNLNSTTINSERNEVGERAVSIKNSLLKRNIIVSEIAIKNNMLAVSFSGTVTKE